MSGPRALVLAKAPVPGKVKTRLGADIGMEAAARLAALALTDTILACTEAFGAARCHLALDGNLDLAVDGPALHDHLSDWWVAPQRGLGFGERLVNAHLDLGAIAPGDGVVQVGMDTPQVTPALLRDAAGPLDDHDAVLGPAQDGGWWVLALRRPGDAVALSGVPMSTPTTCADSRAALEARGLSVAGTGVLRDVDTLADADAVADEAPDTRFAAGWRARA